MPVELTAIGAIAFKLHPVVVVADPMHSTAASDAPGEKPEPVIVTASLLVNPAFGVMVIVGALDALAVGTPSRPRLPAAKARPMTLANNRFIVEPSLIGSVTLARWRGTAPRSRVFCHVRSGWVAADQASAVGRPTEPSVGSAAGSALSASSIGCLWK